MLTSFNNDPLQASHNDPRNNSLQQQINSNSNAAQLNNLAYDYLNNVKENRSLYGNYLDNSLAHDPYKEQKSVYNVVYDTDLYDPWGKPGGGAPKIDNNGHLKTKIVGTLKWNLNGETEDDRAKKLSISSAQKPNNRQTTTYNNNFRNFYSSSSNMNDLNTQDSNNNNQMTQRGSLSNLSSLPQPSQQQQQQQQQGVGGHLPPINLNSSQSFSVVPIEQEAQLRRMERQSSTNLGSSWVHSEKYNRPKGYAELNRISNKLFIDNQPNDKQPNNPYWFGKTGLAPTLSHSLTQTPSYYYSDARRHNLLKALENTTPEFQTNNSQYFNYNN